MWLFYLQNVLERFKRSSITFFFILSDPQLKYKGQFSREGLFFTFEHNDKEEALYILNIYTFAKVSCTHFLLGF